MASPHARICWRSAEDLVIIFSVPLPPLRFIAVRGNQKISLDNFVIGVELIFNPVCQWNAGGLALDQEKRAILFRTRAKVTLYSGGSAVKVWTSVGRVLWKNPTRVSFQREPTSADSRREEYVVINSPTDTIIVEHSLLPFTG